MGLVASHSIEEAVLLCLLLSGVTLSATPVFLHRDALGSSTFPGVARPEF